MLRRRLLTLLALPLLVAPAHRVARAQQPDSRPNVVLILMDDMGYGDLGSYGVTDARTPNLDRLARDGVRLTDAYANGATCSPTRAGLISGQYQQRWGIEWPLGSVPGDSARGLPVVGGSLPALLKQRGYATGLIGKWHLGFTDAYGPNAHGFDEFWGFRSGALDYYTHRRGDGRPDLYENTTPVEAPGYLTDEITTRAVRFIDRHALGPFYLEVAFNAVHWPFEPPGMTAGADHGTRDAGTDDRALFDRPDAAKPRTRADYVRMLERADSGVGEILATLDRRGLRRNTLVIFTNDNGGEWLSRNAPLSNRKNTVWEGGIRVPLILRWPGHLPANATSRQVAITMDLTASILALAGATPPTGYRLDGIDILPILEGKSPVVERRLFWRVRRPIAQTAVRSGRWKLMIIANTFYLFDVAADPGERHDLTAIHPEMVRGLSEAIAAWERDVEAKPAGAVSP